MARELNLRIGRIALREKLADRYLFSKAVEVDRDHLFSVVEIKKPWFEAQQIGQLIVSTFEQTYRSQPEDDSLDRFEFSLRRVNESLALAEREGINGFAGYLASALVLISREGKIHISQAGNSPVYLLRGEKVNSVDQNDETDGAFSSITSGELAINDRLVIANQELFNWLSVENLGKILTGNSVNTGIGDLGRLLQRERARKINVIVIETRDPEETEHTNDSQIQALVYLDQRIESRRANNAMKQIIGSSQALVEVLKPVFMALGRFLLAFYRKSKGRVKTDLLPASDRLIDQLQKSARRFKAENQGLIELLSPSRLSGKLANGLSKTRPFQSLYHVLRPAIRRFKIAFQPFASRRRANLIHLNALTARRARWFLRPGNRRFLNILGVIFLIVISVQNFRFKMTDKKVELEASQVEAIESLTDDLFVSFDQNLKLKRLDQAKESLLEILTETDPVSKTQDPSIIAIRQKAERELDQLTQAVRFRSIEPKLSFKQKDIESFALADRVFFGKDQGGQELFEVSSDSNTARVSTSLPEDEGEINLLASDPDQERLFLTTTKNSLFELTDRKGTLKKQSVGLAENQNQILAGPSMALFGGNIYILDRDNRQIIKYPKAGENFADGVEFLAESAEKPVLPRSLAIDGSVYILEDDGRLLRYSRGELDRGFELKELPTPYERILNPKKVVTDGETPSIYILDAGSSEKKNFGPPRVIEFDKNGSFLRQFIMPDDLTTASDLIVNQKSRTAWILNRGDIYEIEI